MQVLQQLFCNDSPLSPEISLFLLVLSPTVRGCHHLPQRRKSFLRSHTFTRSISSPPSSLRSFIKDRRDEGASLLSLYVSVSIPSLELEKEKRFSVEKEIANPISRIFILSPSLILVPLLMLQLCCCLHTAMCDQRRGKSRWLFLTYKFEYPKLFPHSIFFF